MAIKLIALTIAVPLAMSVAGAPALAGFCESNTGPNVLYCDDFSGVNPLSAYTIPPSVNGSFPSISVVNQQLQWVNAFRGGFVSDHVVNNTAIPYRDTVLSANVEFSTPRYLRSLMGIGYWGSLSSPDNYPYLAWALQLDDQNAYFFFFDGATVFSAPAFYSFAINTPYEISLVVRANGAISGYVGSDLVFQQTVDLSNLPALLYPGFVGDAYGYYPQTQIYTDAIARSIPETSTWTMMVMGFAALGWAAGRRPSGRTANAEAEPGLRAVR